jgi:hypothetical protein
MRGVAYPFGKRESSTSHQSLVTSHWPKEQ